MKTEQTPFLNGADRIGSRLCREAIWAGNQCNWMGWAMEPLHGSWAPAYRSFGSDLYNGTSGIALFMAQLYRFTGEAQHCRAMEGAVNHVLANYRDLEGPGRPGFFSGHGGLAWALVQIGELAGRKELIDKGLDILEEMSALELGETNQDVISGSAGMIPVLLQLAETYGRDALHHLAVTHGEHLLGLAIKNNENWCWDTMKVPGQPPLTGHSHGTAGIATAMSELFASTREVRFHEAALGAIAYERNLFSREQANWPDLRIMDPTATQPGPPVFNMAWCHGAPGIGLSRLRCLELSDGDTELRRELEIALTTTAAAVAMPPRGMDNFSLCHGLGGNTDLLIEAANSRERPELAAQARNVGLMGLERHDKNGGFWPCGVAGAGETPGLLLGISGIGYFYLRLHDSETVPSVLLIRGRS